MKYLFLFFAFLLVIEAGCRKTRDYSSSFLNIEKEIESGNLTKAMLLADSLKSISMNDERIFMKADSLHEIAFRLKLDFSSARQETLDEIEKRVGPVTPEQIGSWENNGWLEGMIIDGEKMYFNRAAGNLVLLKDFHEKKIPADDEEMIARKKHTEEIIKASDGKGNLVSPQKINILYTITVEKDAVPENEMVRCWLPWPKRGHDRQLNIKLLSASQDEYLISPDSSIHSTIYMEKKAEKGLPTVFSISYEYESYARWFNPDSIRSIPYNKESDIYVKYTREELPHINFSREVRRLSDSICNGETEPEQIVFNTWRWFKQNIPWTGAIEYSVLPDITGYACANRRGDCGIQTMMFMSMLRYKGIPVRWQSGWKVPPFGKNLHDWCEVYFEGSGWVPVDISYDLLNSDNENVREFFMTGIDSYRLIVNDGIAGRLYPEKKYLRSEPYDFQRGEVEWSGGNLYFDKWDYEMKIEYR